MRPLPVSLATVVAAALALGCGAKAPAPRDYLAVWTASADSSAADFLAIVDVTRGGERYGDLVTTLPVPGTRNLPHHTEHEMPADAQLFANGFASGRTWIFDLREPTAPRIAGSFTSAGELEHPHSFLRLPNGNVLATYQMSHGPNGMRNGGLAEITPQGEVVRQASADRPDLPADLRVYSAAVLPALDRVVTTTTDMHEDFPARHLQVWRLSDLALLSTFAIPDGPAGGEGLLTAEPRVLKDGRRVLVSTFNCGLYLVDGLDGSTPSATLVAHFPRRDGSYCAIPVLLGDYYLVTVPAWNAVVSLDVRDPTAPREVSRLVLGDSASLPHWIAASADGQRLVITGYGSMRHTVYLADFDPGTGALALDSAFRDTGAVMPGLRLSGRSWPHGGAAAGVPHGAVFTRP